MVILPTSCYSAPMTKRSAVAIYGPHLPGPDRRGTGVTRQLQDCRAEAEPRGWQVAEENVEDDNSAYSGKTRPASP